MAKERMMLGFIDTFIEFAWSLSLILCMYSKWHRFSRPDHFWLGQAKIGPPRPNLGD